MIVNIGLSVQTTIDSREHPGLLNKIGYIGFLGHGSFVKFRNIIIMEQMN